MDEVKVTAKFANNLLERMMGLIGKHEAHGLLINTRFGIHTFFLRFPIDVMVIDKSGKVVALKKHLKPHRLYLWNPKYDRVLEMPENTIEKNNIKIGTNITLAKD